MPLWYLGAGKSLLVLPLFTQLVLNESVKNLRGYAQMHIDGIAYLLNDSSIRRATSQEDANCTMYQLIVKTILQQ